MILLILVYSVVAFLILSRLKEQVIDNIRLTQIIIFDYQFQVHTFGILCC